MTDEFRDKSSWTEPDRALGAAAEERSELYATGQGEWVEPASDRFAETTAADPPPMRGQSGPATRALFVPMTFVMIVLNSAIYAVMVFKSGGFSFSPDFVVQWGGDYAPYTLGGQVWRLFTSTFLHFGLAHLASNMMCLFYWGLVTERALGWRRWLAAYLLSGVIASTSSVLFMHNVVSAGASGSIAGLLGVMLAMFFKGYPGISARLILQNLLLNVVVAFLVPVDWIAHLGGFLAGIAFGMVWLRSRSISHHDL